MKKIAGLTTAIIFAFAGAAGATTVSDYPAGVAANGIGLSRHNLGSFGRVITTTATSEICVFCHTPHWTNKTNNLAPLWNKASQAQSAFTAYGTTIGGTSIANTDLGGATLACLSCHDGVTTFDNLFNAPGAGGVAFATGTYNVNGVDQGWNFGMPSEFVTPNTQFDHFTSAGPCTACHSGDLDYKIKRLAIGSNLSNDHPVSVQYYGDRGGLRPTNTIIASIDLTSDLTSSAPTSMGGNLGQNRWAVKGFISDTATVSDLLRGGKVECTSCHDPHFRNLSWNETKSTWLDGQQDWCGNVGEACSDGLFLRRVGGNSGSGVCRTCHAK